MNRSYLYLQDFLNQYKITEEEKAKNMENQVIRTQAQAINCIRDGKYIIVSVGANGDFSMSVSPAAHTNAISARAECQRLAKLNPGKMFTFMKLTGAELVPATTVSI